MNRFLLMLVVVSLSAVVLAEDVATPGAMTKGDHKAPLMIQFEELKWSALPERKGMQFAVLSGDPAKGEYMQMRKVPAGTNNPLHSHSNEIKNVIISGVWYTGADSASARDFGPGSIVVMPGNWVHVSGCRAGSDCLFYQEGRGKFDFKAVAKADAHVAHVPASGQPTPKLQQFVYVLKVTPALHDESKWTQKENDAVERHFARLTEATKAGRVIFAGRTSEPLDETFGLVVFEAEDESVARQFMESDPAVVAGVMSATLHPYVLALQRRQ